MRGEQKTKIFFKVEAQVMALKENKSRTNTVPCGTTSYILNFNHFEA